MKKTDDAFYREEVRCDYLVTAEMKKIWAVELDLLEKFMEVCEKHDLTYYVSGGTLLGAVRHDGMIPWDDDIDVAMKREDYDKFIKLAGEFRAPYFLQCRETEKGYFRGHAQLRNSETTAILKSEKYTADFNQGIFIDIFPLDVIDSSDERFKRNMRKAGKMYRQMNWFRSYKSVEKHSLKGKVKYLLLKCYYSFVPFEKVYEKHERLCSEVRNENGNEIGMITVFHDNPHFIWNKEDYVGSMSHSFEYLTVNIPKNYHNLLEKQYGDYRKPVRGTTEHGGIIFDTEHSYQEVLKKLR
ncbi:MAG: phosphorylcholine transferase LicD [Lachnospiraceae bacterium]